MAQAVQRHGTVFQTGTMRRSSRAVPLPLRAGPQRPHRQAPARHLHHRAQQQGGPGARLEADAGPRLARLRHVAGSRPLGPLPQGPLPLHVPLRPRLLRRPDHQPRRPRHRHHPVGQRHRRHRPRRVRGPGQRVAHRRPVHHRHQGEFPGPLRQRRRVHLPDRQDASPGGSKGPTAGSTCGTTSGPARRSPSRRRSSAPTRSTCTRATITIATSSTASRAASPRRPRWRSAIARPRSAMLGNIAMRLGRKLHWDPAAERFTDSDEANQMLYKPMRSPWHLG